MPLGSREKSTIRLRIKSEFDARGINAARVNFNRLSDSQVEAARNNIIVGRSLQAAGATMMFNSAKIVAGMGAMTYETASFRKELELATTQALDTAVSVDKLQHVAHNVAQSFAVDMKQIPQVMYDIFSTVDAQMGQVEPLLENFARAAVAGQADLQTVAQQTMNVMNSFAIPIEDSSEVLDTFASMVQFGTGTLDQFMNNIGKISPAAISSGQDLDTMAASFGFLTRMGLNTAMASTSVARALELLTRSQVISNLEQMGVQVKDLGGELLPIDEILGQLNERFSQMTKPEMFEAMDDIFAGSGNRIQARRFFQLVFENFELFETGMERVRNNAISFEDQFEQMADTIPARMQQVANSFMVFSQRIGNELLPSGEQVVEFLEDFIEMLNSLDEEQIKVIVNMLKVSAALLALGGTAAMLVGRFITLKAYMNLGVVTFGTLATSIFGTTAAIGGLAVLVYFLATNLDTVTGVLHQFWEGLQTTEGVIFAIIGVMAALSYRFKEIGTSLGAMRAKVSAHFARSRGEVELWRGNVLGLIQAEEQSAAASERAGARRSRAWGGASGAATRGSRAKRKAATESAAAARHMATETAAAMRVIEASYTTGATAVVRFGSTVIQQAQLMSGALLQLQATTTTTTTAMMRHVWIFADTVTHWYRTASGAVVSWRNYALQSHNIVQQSLLALEASYTRYGQTTTLVLTTTTQAHAAHAAHVTAYMQALRIQFEYAAGSLSRLIAVTSSGTAVFMAFPKAITATSTAYQGLAASADRAAAAIGRVQVAGAIPAVTGQQARPMPGPAVGEGMRGAAPTHTMPWVTQAAQAKQASGKIASLAAAFGNLGGMIKTAAAAMAGFIKGMIPIAVIGGVVYAIYKLGETARQEAQAIDQLSEAMMGAAEAGQAFELRDEISGLTDTLDIDTAKLEQAGVSISDIVNAAEDPNALQNLHGIRQELQGIIDDDNTLHTYQGGVVTSMGDDAKIAAAALEEVDGVINRLLPSIREARFDFIEESRFMFPEIWEDPGFQANIQGGVDVTEELNKRIAQLAQESPEAAEAIEALGLEVDETGEGLQEMTNELSRMAQAFDDVTDIMLDPGNAFEEAMRAEEEAIRARADAAEWSSERTQEAIDNMEIDASQWLAELETQEQDFDTLFENMTTIVGRSTEEIGDDTALAIEHILAMGDSGPEAMRALAEADPEDFLDILEAIRLQSIMSSEAVAEELGGITDAFLGNLELLEENAPEEFESLMLKSLEFVKEHGGDLSIEWSSLLSAFLSNLDGFEGDVTEVWGEVLKAIQVADIEEELGKLTDLQLEDVFGELLQLLEEHDVETAIEMLVSNIETAVEEREQRLRDAFDFRRTIPEEIDAAEKPATDAIENLNRGMYTKANTGFRRVEARASQFAGNLALSINPLLRALNEPTIGLASVGNNLPTAGRSVAANTGGMIPGGGPDRDSVVAALTPGEYVLRRRAVKNLDRRSLDALNSTGDPSVLRPHSSMPRYNEGGWVMPEDLPKPPGFGDISSTPFVEPPTGSTEHAYKKAFEWVKKNSAGNIRAWAQEQIGKPYIWGGVGPAGYDCSGIWSAAQNVAEGRHPHARRFTTASFAGSPPPGWVRGVQGPVVVGVRQGNPGHMSGQIAGWGLESGGRGVVGGGAAQSPFVFPAQFSLVAGRAAQAAQRAGDEHYAMAKGGVVTRRINATLGERGPEAVIPLEKFNHGGLVEHYKNFYNEAFDMLFDSRGKPIFATHLMEGYGRSSRTQGDWLDTRGRDPHGREIKPWDIRDTAKNAETASEWADALEEANAMLAEQEELIQQRERYEQKVEHERAVRDAKRAVSAAEDSDERERARDELKQAEEALQEWHRSNEEASRQRQAQAWIERIEREAAIAANKEQWYFEKKTAREQLGIIEDRIEAERAYTDEWISLKEQEKQIQEEILEQARQARRTAASDELEILRRTRAVEDAEKALEDLNKGRKEENRERRETAQAALREAKANEAAARASRDLADANLQRVMQIVPHLDNEVAGLLKKYQAEYELAEAEAALEEASNKRREADKDLQEVLADSKVSVDELREAELQLIIAQEDLKLSLYDLMDSEQDVKDYFNNLTGDANAYEQAMASLRRELARARDISQGGAGARYPDSASGASPSENQARLDEFDRLYGGYYGGMAKGGIALANRRGMLAHIAEGGQDEAVLPLPQGAKRFIAGIDSQNDQPTTIDYHPEYNITISGGGEGIEQTIKQQLEEHDREFINMLKGMGVNTRL